MLSLAHASLLLLAPLGFLAVAIATRTSAQTLGPLRRAASLVVRGGIVLLLTLALGGPVFTRVAELPRNTIFLLDASESLPQEAYEEALAKLRPIWNREVAGGNRCALVAFAGDTDVLLPPTTAPLEPTSERSSFKPSGVKNRAATDIARALDCARSLFQENHANRVVLLSDGVDSTRPAREISLPPGTIGVSLADEERLDVAVTDVQAPSAVRSGEPFDVRVTVTTNRACEFGLSAVMGETGIPEATKRFTAPGPGRHVVVLPHLQQKGALPADVYTLMVIAEAPGDRERRNNIGQTAITVVGKPKVLLVQGAEAEGEFIARILRSQDIEFDRRSPAELRPDGLDEFVAVVLAGVPRESLSAAAVDAIRRFVEQSGGGLWVVGSAALQGQAGYAGSEFEKLLPVAFSDAVSPTAAKDPRKDPPPTPPAPTPGPPDVEDAKPQKVLAPSVALLLVVDKSGSMAGRNIEIVKEACIKTAKNLSPKDVIGVLAFDYNPTLVLEFTEADRIDYIEQRILRLLASGGTRIYPALVDALRLFELDPRARRCSVKHAILLSDGDAPPADYETVVRRMAEDGITVSTVCVSGAKFDPALMSRIASWGKGRFKFTNSFENVPEYILNETQKVLGSVPRDDNKKPAPAPAPKDQPPPPSTAPPPDPPQEKPPLQAVVLKEGHEIFAGIDGRGLPGLRGRLAGAARPKADVPLTTAEGQPVLALGRLGLGKTAVWMSDLSGRWSADWLPWKDSPKLFAQLLRYVSGSGADAELAGRVRLRRDGDRTLLRIDPEGPGGALTITDVTEKDAPRPVEISRDAQAEGVATLRGDRPGRMRRLLLQRADGKKLVLGSLRAYEEEFAPADPSHQLFANGLTAVTWNALDATLVDLRISGERRRDLTPWLIIVALLFLPLDVALRRVQLR
jgi:Mg-chelatase subunit ChlD